MAGEARPTGSPDVGADVGAVVLTGGTAVRLGGADKASIEIGGETLLEHALNALADVPEVVVVGPEVPTSRPVTFTREDPAGGGPAAGVLAGIRRFARTPAWVVVLAVDMPLVSAATIRRLVQAVRDDGAVLVDSSGRAQHLCAAYSPAALDRAGQPSDDRAGHGLSMRRLVDGLRLVQVDAEGSETQDVDTWEDLARLRDAVVRPPVGSPERHEPPADS